MEKSKKRITVQSGKAKGRRLQQDVRDAILATFPSLTDRDVQSTSMGAGGVDVKLSQAAADLFPYSVECKWHEAISIWSCLKQAEENKEDLTPLLVFKRNRSETYCCLKLEDFMNLVKGEKE